MKQKKSPYPPHVITDEQQRSYNKALTVLGCLNETICGAQLFGNSHFDAGYLFDLMTSPEWAELRMQNPAIDRFDDKTIERASKELTELLRFYRQHRIVTPDGKVTFSRNKAVTCIWCAGTMPQVRSDTRYCSPRCRQAAYRNRKKAEGTA